MRFTKMGKLRHREAKGHVTQCTSHPAWRSQVLSPPGRTAVWCQEGTARTELDVQGDLELSCSPLLT